MKTAAYWIEHLGLERHPEGGYFRETYRSDGRVAADALPERFGGARPFSTAIYFLLEGNDLSALHRIASDEVWHFYAGASLSIHIIHPNGSYSAIELGRNVGKGAALQALVPAGCWFGATVNDSSSYSLVGCTVAPGFDFADLEMADRTQLTQRYPQHKSIVERLTR